MTARNVAFATVSSGSAVLMALVYFAAARFLGTEGFTIFSYALAVSMIGEALIDMGAHQLTIREVAQVPDSRFALLRQQLGLKLITGTTVIIVGLLGTVLITQDPTELLVVAVMLGSSLLRSWFLSVRGGLIGLEAFGKDAALVAGDRLLLTVAGTGALWLGVDVLGLALVFLGTRVITVTLALVLTRHDLGVPTWRYEPAAWSALQRRAFPLGAFMIVLTAYNYVDTIMLFALAPEDDTALYNAAYRIYEGTAYAAAVLWSVLTPRLSALWTTDRPAHQRLARLGIGAGLGLAVPIGLVLWVGADLWIRWLPGAEYAASAWTLQLLALGLPLVFVIWVLHAIATSSSHDRLLVRCTAIGLVANVGLNLWLIPRSGHEGAALATVLGEGITMCLLIGGLWRVLRGATETPT